MNLITTLLIWTWLLGISFVIPTKLPAGGAQEAIIMRRENNIISPLIALKEFNLFSSPSPTSSILKRAKVGTPVNILKVMHSNETGKWLLVNISNKYSYQFFSKRGWVNISSFC